MKKDEYTSKLIAGIPMECPSREYVRNSEQKAYEKGWKDAIELVRLIPTAVDIVELARRYEKTCKKEQEYGSDD